LREEGFGGPVVLIGRQAGAPFGRPPLSKPYLRSEADPTSWSVGPPGWYDANDVELRTDAVAAVDPAAHRLVLGSGQDLAYQRSLMQ
jgi:3-phenylpropionate/trans-cinnamate dioxygenase ferredoxin reductase component